MSAEHAICKALMQWVRHVGIHMYPCLEDFRHIPNEGRRSKKIAYEQGIKKGALDYQMLVPCEQYYGFCLEIKDTGKEPTAAQEREMQSLRRNGYFAGWTDNLDKAIEIVDGYCKMVHND